MSESFHVVVVGAGIAGLTTAYRLLHPVVSTGSAGGHGSRETSRSVAVTVVEADSRAGGKIRTESFDGFVVEAGPDSFLTTKPWALALADELGLRQTLRGTRPWRHRAFICRDGVLHPLPDGLSGVVPAHFGAWWTASVLSWPGRLRAMLDLLIPAARTGDDESIADFVRRRFGREAWDWLIEPLLAGIHAGNGERLGVHSAFPALAEAERRGGSVTRGLRRMQHTRRALPPTASGSPKAPASTFVAPQGGMQRFVEALVARLAGCDLRFGQRVAALTRSDGRWHVRTDTGLQLVADAAVLAVPANVAATILGTAAPGLAESLRAIGFASSVVVHAAFDAGAARVPLEGHGYLNPRRARRTVAACTWTSSKFEGRAPDGTILLRAFLKGGVTADPALLGDGEAVSLVRDEWRETLGISADPLWVRVYRYPSAMPQYEVGHGERVAAIEREADRLNGLLLTGNSYHGVGIPDTIRSAERVAHRVLSLTRPTAGWPTSS